MMQTAKTVMILSLVLVALMALAPAVGAQGILDTRHNLSSTAGNGTEPTGRIQTTGTARVCVFCHTPHGGATDAPLWNRAINTTANAYSMYTSPSFDSGSGVTAPTGASLACLSCHDGTIAFDALRNLPGSGGFSNSPETDGTRTNWVFTRGGSGSTFEKMPTTDETNSTNVRLLGTDLTNDHPISMDYASAKSPSSSSGINDHNTGFNSPVITMGGDDYFEQSGGAGTGVKISNGKVQCTSCHDPHRADTPTFLRKDNSGSALCLTCHKKNV